MRTVREPARDLPVVAEADVLVVGGGSAGLAAAVAAARDGATVILIERYGYVGGMATGGLVLVLDDYSDGEREVVSGLTTTLVRRLVASGGAVETPPEARYTRAEAASRAWAPWGFQDFHAQLQPKPIVYAVSFDAEAFKMAGNDLLAEAGVTVRYHSWAAGALMDGDRVVGVALETKEGRQAALGRVVVDASGDGDVFVSAGAPHIRGRYIVSLAHRLGGIDVERALEFERERPEQAGAINREARRLMGGSWERWWLRTVADGVVWVNAPHLTGYDAALVVDQTRAEIEGRKLIAAYLPYVRASLPGFERAYLLDTSPQLGVRQTRLLEGEYVVTKDDILERREFEDRIARGWVYSTPYRALLPRGVEGLLVAGRCYSATPEAQRMSREIAPCMAMGEAAGIAAALAAGRDSSPRRVSVPTLQRRLREVGAIL